MNVAELFLTSQPDWMQIDHGNVVQVGNAVRGYAKLSHGEMREPYEVGAPLSVVISSHALGFTFLTFSRPIPPYVFVNLLGWLDAPPEIAGVSGARGWYRAPGNNERFALYPDRSNRWGDTLLGYSTAGRKIEVYQPEVWICESTKKLDFFAEPSIEPDHVKQLARLEISLDTDPAFSSPTFQITHPADTNWNL